MNKLFALIVFSLVFFNSFSLVNRNSVLTYTFAADSLSGFNEEDAKKEALLNGFLGQEFEVYLYQVKRNFINKKYNQANSTNSLDNPSFYKMNNAPCVNEDFEASPVGPVAPAAPLLPAAPVAPVAPVAPLRLPCDVHAVEVVFL